MTDMGDLHGLQPTTVAPSLQVGGCSRAWP
jgi:hypothetical protein